MTIQDHRFSKLRPENAAMLLIDHQVGTLTFGIADLDPLNLKNNTMWLAEAAKIHKLPVILTTSNPHGANGPLFPELTAAFPDVEIIDRMIIDAWQDPKFVEAVKKTGRKQLIMAGVTADVCLTFPAIGAAGDGYDVYAVMDASGAPNMHAMYASMLRMSQAGVKIANTNMVNAELQLDWSLPSGAQTGAAYANRLPNFGYISANLASHANGE